MSLVHRPTKSTAKKDTGTIEKGCIMVKITVEKVIYKPFKVHWADKSRDNSLRSRDNSLRSMEDENFDIPKIFD